MFAGNTVKMSLTMLCGGRKENIFEAYFGAYNRCFFCYCIQDMIQGNLSMGEKIISYTIWECIRKQLLRFERK